MYYRCLCEKAIRRKGISPVIATVILVAVAVVIAAALAGFSSSLFGSYAQGPQITMRTVEMNTLGVGTIDIVNKGTSPESVIKVAATIAGVSYDALESDATVTNGVVQANSANDVSFDLGIPVADRLESGQQVAITVTTANGLQYVLETRAQ